MLMPCYSCRLPLDDKRIESACRATVDNILACLSHECGF